MDSSATVGMPIPKKPSIRASRCPFSVMPSRSLLKSSRCWWFAVLRSSRCWWVRDVEISAEYVEVFAEFVGVVLLVPDDRRGRH